MAVRFFTDSCCDLPKEYVQERDFSNMPMLYTVDGKDYYDDYGESLSYHDFYEKLRAGIPSVTAQLTASYLEEQFTPWLEKGDDIFYLVFSSALSGTYQSALLAKNELAQKFPERRVEIVDSISASMGQGLLMHHILNLRDEGKSLDEILDWTQKNKGRLCHWFTVYDLNHLKRGGRVTAAAAFFGTMLSIKPVLHVDDQGRLIAMEKVKGRPKAVKSLFEHMKATVQEPEGQTVFISHGDGEKDALLLADMVRQEFGITDIVIHHIGPIVGTHSGPDTLALFFLGSPR